MSKVCVEPGCCGGWHARRRCFDHWVELVQREARAATANRKPDRRIMLFMEARRARQDGDTARHRFILKNRKLPEEAMPHGLPKGRLALRNQVAERTFVSDIELDNGTGGWHGFEYFGDVSRDNWPELERYGLGGRDMSRMRKM